MAYRYVKNKRDQNQQDISDSLNSMVSSLSRSMMPDQVVMKIPQVAAKLVDDSTDYIPGILTIVEKSVGVFIEWYPCEDADASWVMTSEDGNMETIHSKSPTSTEKSIVDDYSKLAFSLDVNDLSSFVNVEPKKGKGSASVKFICKDGSSYIPLYFNNQSTNGFFDVLQRYITLRRSAREANLVMVVDQKAEALAKSVSMLDQNGDILSRLMQNPYKTAMTQFSKITTFVQDQVIPSVLNDDAVSQEEQIRLMQSLVREDYERKMRVHTEDGGEYELVTQLELPPRPEIYRESPVTLQMWNNFKTSDGSIDAQKLRDLKLNIFRGGLHSDVRKEAWKLLLGYRKWEESNDQFEKRRSKLAKEYENMKKQWMSITEDQEKRFSKYSKRKSLVEKDVARTDRMESFFQGDGNSNLEMLHNVLMTYVMYNFDLGYVQGMSDFASPLLYVMKNEVDTFWCFVGLMEITNKNFEKDQAFIKLQMNQLRDLIITVNPRLANYLESHQSDDMYFCFRWVLVWFKREFSFMETCKLWEVLWTAQPCPKFLLLICVAILDSESNVIIDNKFGLTEILKHINDLSMRMNVDKVLTDAEAIFHQLSASQNKLPNHICRYLNIGETAISTPSTPSKSGGDN